MGEIRAYAEPVRFAYAEAERLAAALRAAAAELDSQSAVRRGWAEEALREWRGVFAERFRSDAALAAADAREFAGVMREGANQLDELARRAREEQTRRDRAAAWQAEQDREGALEKWWESVTGTDELPPYTPTTQDAGSVVLRAPSARPRG